MASLTNDQILEAKYPAKAHARKVAAKLKEDGCGDAGVIYLEGQKTHMVEDNDEAMHFRQRRNFHYLSGCEVPDSYLIYDIADDKLSLFIPPIDPDSVIWAGLPLSPEDAMKKYDIDACYTTEYVNAQLAHTVKENPANTTVYIIPEQVSPEITFLPFDDKNITHLRNAIEESRVVKDEYEIAMLRRTNEVSSNAHQAVWRIAKKAKNEQELEAVFVALCMSKGCKEMSYHPITASGCNAATLHYVRNDEDVTQRLNVLMDSGAEYRTYCADITRTFPLNGKFTKESREIYDIVYEMMNECFKVIKAGVLWDDVHALAHRVAIKGLLKLGILKGTEEELFEKGISVPFFPHGLGHYLGMDTHDVGGHPNYDDPNPMFRYLRCRLRLPVNSVITVEPGVYFCRFQIEPYLNNPETAKYINTEVLERYWAVGGVRLEDDIVIKEDGFENLSIAPKDPDYIEKVVSEGCQFNTIDEAIMGTI
ncbi:xaa-Pro aminopeptidase [Ascosphaera apis ARSEF 7405]|uniref:Probable Xaa-Pro aminopeptidase PEPP n=1 Tax=Ascosphaera apis ARSEF 7405 TaxID=392613 RepID=A0A166N8U6_9EURO|nr:xaa-Pro aminopeptidase [Ascosphaera apis ARSEF 7405]